jgi:hypothetical protein
MSAAGEAQARRARRRAKAKEADAQCSTALHAPKEAEA